MIHVPDPSVTLALIFKEDDIFTFIIYSKLD